MNQGPWRGVIVATALPLRDDLSVDLDRYAEHVSWLLANGCDGVCPNGSLGEYQTLTPAERASVVRTAVDVAGGDRVLVFSGRAYAGGGGCLRSIQAPRAVFDE